MTTPLCDNEFTRPHDALREVQIECGYLESNAALAGQIS